MARNIPHSGHRKSGGGSPVPRRSILKGLGLAVGSGALGLAAPAVWAARHRSFPWASAGQRWEFPQRGVYRSFQKKSPTSRCRSLPSRLPTCCRKRRSPWHRKAIATTSSTKTTTSCRNSSPSARSNRSSPISTRTRPTRRTSGRYPGERARPLPRQAGRAGRQALRPAADSNCQLQFIPRRLFDKASLKPAVTWDEAIGMPRSCPTAARRRWSAPP